MCMYMVCMYVCRHVFTCMDAGVSECTYVGVCMCLCLSETGIASEYSSPLALAKVCWYLTLILMLAWETPHFTPEPPTSPALL